MHALRTDRRIDDVTDHMDELRRTDDALHALITSLVKEDAHLRDNIGLLSIIAGDVYVQLDQQRRTIHADSERLDAADDALRTALENLEERVSAHHLAETEQATAQSLLNLRQSVDLARAKGRLDGLDASMDALAADTAGRFDDVRVRTDALQAQADATDARMADNQLALADQTSRQNLLALRQSWWLAQLEQRLADTDGRITDNQLALTDQSQRQNLADLRHAELLVRLEQRFASAEAEIVALRTDNAALRERLASTESSLADLEERYDASRLALTDQITNLARAILLQSQRINALAGALPAAERHDPVGFVDEDGGTVGLHAMNFSPEDGDTVSLAGGLFFEPV